MKKKKCATCEGTKSVNGKPCPDCFLKVIKITDIIRDCVSCGSECYMQGEDGGTACHNYKYEKRNYKLKQNNK